jgi:hypothetical protein
MFPSTRFLLFCFLAIPTYLSAQSYSVTVPSTTGYSVTVGIEFKSILLNSPLDDCRYGTSYQVGLDYTLKYTGTSIPSALYVLQLQIGCSNNSTITIDDSKGASGTVFTPGYYIGGNQSPCSSITLTSLNCGAANLIISGPGISSRTVAFELALPIELSSFTAEAAGQTVRLDWTTSNEQDNEYFSVHRSQDAKNWKTIATVPGAGTIKALQHYRFEDKSYSEGTVYYRLQQTDFDGTHSMSDIVYIDMRSTGASSIYPNPAGSQITVAGDDRIRIYSVGGHDMTHLTSFSSAESSSEIKVDISLLPIGFYYVRAQSYSARFFKR